MLHIFYQATLLVCLAGTPIQDCNREVAISVLPLDVQREMRSPIDCLLEGQMSAARSTYLLPGEVGRVMCKEVREVLHQPQ